MQEKNVGRKEGWSKKDEDGKRGEVRDQHLKGNEVKRVLRRRLRGE